MPELKLENSLVDGRYEVFERLGRGSYSEIFVARDRQAGGMEVVIKALNTSLQGTPDVDLERTLIENFQNEAIALDAVRHSNVILRLGHGTAADLRRVPFHYLVLEYLPGGDLLRLCRERPRNSLRLEEALYYFKQASEALVFAHSHGIIHRDLKPNNFLLTVDHQTLKIADFGVARLASSESEKAEVTRVGADVYAPPEHNPYEEAVYSERLTVSADIYSLAKSFYTVICGRAPAQFRCDPITSLPPEIMQEPYAEFLLKVLCRATDDEPGRRYGTVVEFWSDLVQVATIPNDEAGDESTVVRPRLNVSQGVMPRTPTTPDFEPALAALGSRAAFTSAKPVSSDRQSGSEGDREDGAELRRHSRRASRFFINLQESKSPIPVQTGAAPAAAPVPAAPPVAGGEVRTTAGTGIRSRAQRWRQTASIGFSDRVRRRLFYFLLTLAVLGAGVSSYNFVRYRVPAFGFGPPTEIEVISPGLNVRAGPGTSYRAIGIIAKGSKHKVLEIQPDQRWLQIEVGQWEDRGPHEDQKQGWVSASPDLIQVVSRRIW
ncbi:MAG TPA: serine/threonine protein kinase [Blastocatellia bacterium]|nr:serine/threonine protein kinase [Blastocatellia bacterium]